MSKETDKITSMKKIITTLVFLLVAITSYAYKATFTHPEYINFGTKTTTTNVDPEPTAPFNNGGTVFKVTYDDDVPFQMKAAFEHACKLWEERMRHNLPITVAVHIDNLGYTNTNCKLSKVNRTFCKKIDNSDANLLMPALKFIFLNETETARRFDHSKDYHDIICDTILFDNPNNPDISITYNSAYLDEFSFALAEDSPTNKYDFISIALKDLKFGIGFAGDSNQLKLGAIERGKIFNLPYDAWDSLGWDYHIPSSISEPLLVKTFGSEFVAPYKGYFTSPWKDQPQNARTRDKNAKTKKTSRIKASELSAAELYCLDHTVDIYYLESGRKTKGGPYVLSILKKDGTWQIVSDSHSDYFSLETLNIAQYDINSFARTSKGHLRVRLDDIDGTTPVFGYECDYTLSQYYFSMSYLPQAVQLNYEGVEYVNNLTGMTEDKIDPNPLNIDLSKYTKYHRISLKDTEGANMLRIFNGSNIMTNRNFKSGSFRLKDNGKPTLVSVTAVNDNGSTAGGNVSYNLGTVVGPIHPFQPLLKSNGQTLTFVPDGNDSTETDHFVSYAISSVSELNQTTMTGDFEEDQTVDISTLRPDMYVINCLGASGNTYSFKFTKK